jgi:hypothetical protein
LRRLSIRYISIWKIPPDPPLEKGGTFALKKQGTGSTIYIQKTFYAI